MPLAVLHAVMHMSNLAEQERFLGVQEYLAVGEAPDEIRNCFQQRSRWTKVKQVHMYYCRPFPSCRWACRLAPGCLLDEHVVLSCSPPHLS